MSTKIRKVQKKIDNFAILLIKHEKKFRVDIGKMTLDDIFYAEREAYRWIMDSDASEERKEKLCQKLEYYSQIKRKEKKMRDEMMDKAVDKTVKKIIGTENIDINCKCENIDNCSDSDSDSGGDGEKSFFCEIMNAVISCTFNKYPELIQNMCYFQEKYKFTRNEVMKINFERVMTGLLKDNGGFFSVILHCFPLEEAGVGWVTKFKRETINEEQKEIIKNTITTNFPEVKFDPNDHDDGDDEEPLVVDFDTDDAW